MKKIEIAAMQKYANAAHQDWLRAKIAVTEALIKGDRREELAAREEEKTCWYIRYGMLMTLRAVGANLELDALSLEIDRELDALDEQLKKVWGIN